MSSKINLQTCEYARKSSIFQDNQLISKKSTNKYQRSGLEDNPSLGSKEYKSSGTNPRL